MLARRFTTQGVNVNGSRKFALGFKLEPANLDRACPTGDYLMRLALPLALLLTTSLPAVAEMPTPTDHVLLTLGGAVTETNLPAPWRE
ncbi:MAG: hypothetical protein AAFX90_00785 [Pseudomonadota bacterium]